MQNIKQALIKYKISQIITKPNIMREEKILDRHSDIIKIITKTIEGFWDEKQA